MRKEHERHTKTAKIIKASRTQMITIPMIIVGRLPTAMMTVALGATVPPVAEELPVDGNQTIQNR